MANNVHEEDADLHKVRSHRRGLRVHREPDLLGMSESDRPIEQAVTWADVKSNIMVEEVAALATSALVKKETLSGAHVGGVLSSALSSSTAAAASNLVPP